MKKLLLSAGVAALFAAAGVAVQAADQTIQLNTTVTAFCTISGEGPITPDLGTIQDGFLEVEEPEDVPIGDVVCNSASNVTLSSANGAFITSTADADGFQNYINYSASVTSPAAVTVNANSTSGTTNPISAGPVASLGASSGAVSVTLTPVANTEPLVAGTYSDVLTVTIEPTA